MAIFRRFVVVVALVVNLILFPNLALAQTEPDCTNPNKPTPLSCIPYFFTNLTNASLGFAGIAAVVFIIIGGIKFLTSGGDQEKVDNAKKTLTYAIIGLLVVLLSFTIIKVVALVSGTDCIKQFGIGNCQ